MPFIYRPRTIQQLRNAYNRKVRNGYNGFVDFNDFSNWFYEQELVCKYCSLSEEDLQELSMTSILTSKRFPQNGLIGQGTCRSVWLEIDRINPNELYTRNNCALACYFCNNDKSDVFDGQSYVDFFQNRVGFLRSILAESRENRNE